MGRKVAVITRPYMSNSRTWI